MAVKEPTIDRDSPIFRVSIIITLAVLVLFSPLILLGLGWFLEAYEEVEGAAPVSHRVHEVSFGILFALALVGALTQRRAPTKNVAGMQQLVLVVVSFTLVMWLGLGVLEWVSLLYLVPVAAAGIFHPAGRRLVWPPLRPSLIGLALTAVAILPLVDAAGRELERAGAQAQNHSSHWGAMGAFFVIVLLLSLLAALRPPGHRVVAVSVGSGIVVYSLASLVFAFDASSHPSGWAAFAMLWGLAWAATGIWYPEARRRKERKTGVLRQMLVAVAAFGGTFVGLFVAVIWAGGDDPPNVPHSLEVPYEQANPQTCLACHGTGEEGAPDVPHEFPRDGISDCLACHQYDPDLIAPIAQANRNAWGPAPEPSLPLTADQLSGLRGTR